MLALSETPSAVAWRILACAAVTTVGSGAYLGFSMPAQPVLVAALLCTGLMGVSHLGRTRCRSDAVAEISALFAFWIAMLSVLLPASYLAASLNFGFVDATLQSWDQTIGFDWLALQSWTDATEWAAWLLTFVYLGSAAQILVAVFSLAALRDIPRLNVYVTALLLGTICTIVVSAFLPALGAYPVYGFTANPSGMIGKYADVLAFKVDVMALRSGAMRELTGPFAGIITFPSYHTIVAVLAAWATWNMKWLRYPNAAATVLVIISTLPIGGHHFVDLIAGYLVACGSVLVAKKLETSTAAARSQHFGRHQPISDATAQ